MKIGFIGLGIMGAPMALNLIKGGHELAVFAPRKVPAELVGKAAVCASSAEVAQKSDVIILMVPDTPDVEQVRRVEAHRHERRARQGVRPRRLPPAEARDAVRTRHRRRPHHRGHQPDEQGVRQRRRHDRAERRPTRHPRREQRPPDDRREHLEVQARDRQQVRRAGARERIVHVRVDPFPTPEQQRLRQRRHLGVDRPR